MIIESWTCRLGADFWSSGLNLKGALIEDAGLSVLYWIYIKSDICHEVRSPFVQIILLINDGLPETEFDCAKWNYEEWNTEENGRAKLFSNFILLLGM